MASIGTISSKITPLFRGGPIRWLILGGVLLIATIAIGATIMAGNFRERALRNSERELENTVLLLARHFDQQLEVSTCRLRHLTENHVLKCWSVENHVADGV